MKILGSVIHPSDFLPPLVPKAFKKLQRRWTGSARSASDRLHPFDCIPQNIDPRVMIDIGANVGDVTLAALATYPGLRAICYEPVSSTRQVLETRLSAGFAGRFEIRPVALGESPATAEIRLTNHHGANSLMEQTSSHKKLNPHLFQTGTETIQIARLDDEAKNLPQRTDIVKIDVEGFETQVLAGGRKYLSECCDLIVIEISMMRDQELGRQAVVDIFTEMRGLGFALVNAFDFHHSSDPNLMLAQMDCVFRNLRFLPKQTLA